MKAYIVGEDKALMDFFSELEFTEKLKEAKLVIFGEGPIVSPSLYQEKKMPAINLKCDINRDRSDKAIYTKLKKDQIAVGVGRGACFLAVMNGAKLIQNVIRKNSEASYMVELKKGSDKFNFTAISDWKQVINIENCEEFDLIARSSEIEECITDNNDLKRFIRVNGNPELIRFHKNKQPVSICIQYRPEWLPESYLSKLTKRFVYECANS